MSRQAAGANPRRPSRQKLGSGLHWTSDAGKSRATAIESAVGSYALVVLCHQHARWHHAWWSEIQHGSSPIVATPMELRRSISSVTVDLWS
jgi:hypothetical protein